ncbi:hypothetical protein [Paenibacillus sp. NPDC058174]|uniref:hypothetical protein n=1 Tax=Paenibacillus sp. NPDC058174 TaxID=3346366 RepID=UPI0036DCFB69
MASDKITGYRVIFRMGRFNMNVYMKPEYYENWKDVRDKKIKDVSIEEVTMHANQFIG